MPEGTSVSSSSQSARLAQAKSNFQQAVGFMQAQQYPAAEALLKRVLKALPKHANSHQLLSVIASESNDLTQALKSINLAMSYDAHNPDFYFNRAMIYKKLTKNKHAIADLEHAITIKRSYYPAYRALGMLHQTLQHYEKAIAYYEQGLKWVNTDAIVWEHLTAAYCALKQYANAIKCCDISLHLNPNQAKTYATLGILYRKLLKWEQAKNAFEKALQLDPTQQQLLTPLFICNISLCDWERHDEALQWITAEFARHSATHLNYQISSFEALGLPFNNEEQLKIARHETQQLLKSLPSLREHLKFKHRPHQNPRLRIGYISSSFRNYPTGHLTQDLYAAHDRAHFEVFAYSYGDNDDSIYRHKIMQGCDHFIDIKDASIAEACHQIYADKIDILIDLMGATSGARLEISALRPAPINVRYLGAPGTSGTDFFDYIITDGFITPEAVQPYYTEHLVLMPHSYQVNPLQQIVSPEIPTRKACGLPETAMVFCAFNNSYKIEPMIFRVWLNILTAVPNSVLWLQASGAIQNNLIQAAAQQGIHAERLVFAARLPKNQHLARHQHADLYLDTHFYNAHTTASDALWMNVPVITFPGQTFQSRVAGSLLNALGLQELIMPDLPSYEKLAITLGNDRAALMALKQKLATHCQTSPLFDTKRFVGNLEKALQQMWSHYQHNKKSLINVGSVDNSLGCAVCVDF